MNYPPPLPVRHFTRWDFYGVLFVNFPAEWPWEQARRELERMIRRNGDTEITPVTVLCAFSAEHRRILENLPGHEIEKRALAAWKERAETRRAAGLKAAVPAPRYIENGAHETDPLAMRWNREKRRGEFLNPEAAERQLEKNRAELEARLHPPKPSPAKPKPETDWSF